MTADQTDQSPFLRFDARFILWSVPLHEQHTDSTVQATSNCLVYTSEHLTEETNLTIILLQTNRHKGAENIHSVYSSCTERD